MSAPGRPIWTVGALHHAFPLDATWTTNVPRGNANARRRGRLPASIHHPLVKPLLPAARQRGNEPSMQLMARKGVGARPAAARGAPPRAAPARSVRASPAQRPQRRAAPPARAGPPGSDSQFDVDSAAPPEQLGVELGPREDDVSAGGGPTRCGLRPVRRAGMRPVWGERRVACRPLHVARKHAACSRASIGQGLPSRRRRGVSTAPSLCGSKQTISPRSARPACGPCLPPYLPPPGAARQPR
jgi:hypothetical protein